VTHRGPWISAFLDGQLSAAEERRALEHVAECRACADELAAAQAARRALAAADDVPPAPDLTARLLSLAPTSPPRPAAPADPFGPPAPAAAFASYGLASSRIDALRGAPLSGRVRPRRSPARIAAGSAAGLGALAAMLFALGARPDVTPVSQPAADLGLLRNGVQLAAAVSTSTGTGGTCSSVDAGRDVAAWLRGHRWAFPSELPAGWTLTGVRWCADWASGAAADAAPEPDSHVLELDLSGPTGSVVVTEQPGRIDDDAAARSERRVVGGRDALVLSTEPWHVVWQARDTVVQLLAAGPSDEVAGLVAAFPGGAYDGGVPARIVRGLETVTGATQRP
jgi:hypothetical protein